MKKQTRKTKTKIKTKNIVTYKKGGGDEKPIVKHIPMAFSSTGDKVVYGESFKTEEYYNHDSTGRNYQYRKITVHRAHVRCALLENDYVNCVSSSGAKRHYMSHTGTVRSVALRPVRNIDDDTVVVATGDDSGSVCIWTHMPYAKYMYDSNQLHEDLIYTGGTQVNSVAFSPDGTKVVAGFNNGSVRIWTERGSDNERKWLSGQSVTAIMSVKNGKVTSVAFNNNGTKVVAGYNDGTARIWEVKDRKTTEPMMIMMHNSSKGTSSVAFSPDGEKVVAGYHDGTVIIWDVKPVEEPAIANDGSDPDAIRSAEPVDSTRAEPVDSTSAEPVDSTNEGPVDIANAGPDVIASEENEIKGGWPNISGLKMPKMTRLFGRKSLPSSPAPPSSPPPSYPLAKCLKKMEVHGGSVTSVAFSPDGKSVVSGSRDETVRIWDVESDAEPKKILVNPRTESSVNPRIVSSVAFTDNDNVIFGYHYVGRFAENAKIVCIFNVESGEIKKKSIVSD